VTSLRYLDAKFHHPSPKIKKIPKNTNGRLAIPALAGLLVLYWFVRKVDDGRRLACQARVGPFQRATAAVALYVGSRWRRPDATQLLCWQ